MCQVPFRVTLAARGPSAGSAPACLPSRPPAEGLTSALSTKNALRGVCRQHKLHLFILFSFFFSSECFLSPSALLPHHHLFLFFFMSKLFDLQVPSLGTVLGSDSPGRSQLANRVFCRQDRRAGWFEQLHLQPTGK